jgi:uncharacterized membrane protein YcaP (DUF421 family)
MDAKTWNDMFQLGLPLLEKIIRPIIVYLFMIVALRLAGKRELAQLNPFDLVVLLMLSNTVQNAIIGEDNSVTGGVIGAATLLIVNYAVVRFLYNHDKIDRWIEGDATVLIEDGELLKTQLAKERITIPELEEAARKQGIDSLSVCQRAVLEQGGAISFIIKKPEAEEVRYQELLKHLEEIKGQLDALTATR